MKSENVRCIEICKSTRQVSYLFLRHGITVAPRQLKQHQPPHWHRRLRIAKCTDDNGRQQRKGVKSTHYRARLAGFVSSAIYASAWSEMIHSPFRARVSLCLHWKRWSQLSKSVRRINIVHMYDVFIIWSDTKEELCKCLLNRAMAKIHCGIILFYDFSIILVFS